MGRKLGVIQEIICRKLLMQSQRLVDAVIFEPFLMGASGADHKVEFVFFQPKLALNFSLAQNQLGAFTINKRQSQRVGDLTITLLSTNTNRAKFSVEQGGRRSRFTLLLHQIVKSKLALEVLGQESSAIKLSAVGDGTARLVFLNIEDVRASVESKRVGAQRFSSSDKLGSGIQTIEKAKQASLVALDADLKFNGNIKALSEPGASRRFISVVVLGNGVHWTEKDVAIMRTYVDFTFLARDASIIRYLDYVRAKADAEHADFKTFLMAYFVGMTKQPPDTFAVTANDLKIITPEEETRPLNQILDEHLDDYPEQ